MNRRRTVQSNQPDANRRSAVQPPTALESASVAELQAELAKRPGRCKHLKVVPIGCVDHGARGVWFVTIKCKGCGKTGYYTVDPPDEDTTVDWDDEPR